MRGMPEQHFQLHAINFCINIANNHSHNGNCCDSNKTKGHDAYLHARDAQQDALSAPPVKLDTDVLFSAKLFKFRFFIIFSFKLIMSQKKN